MRLHTLNFRWASIFTPGTRIYDSLLMKPKRLSVGMHLLPCCIFAAIFELELQSSHSSLDNRLHCLVGDDLFFIRQPLLHRRSVAKRWLFHCYFYGKCSDKSSILSCHSFRPLLLGHATLTELNHPYFLRVPNVRTKFYQESFSLRTTTTTTTTTHWRECFSEHWNLDPLPHQVS